MNGDIFKATRRSRRSTRLFDERGSLCTARAFRLHAHFELGEQCMRALGYLFVLACALLISAPVSAEAGKLKTGDMIFSVDRTEIATASELISAIEGNPSGTAIHFRVTPGGYERRVTMKFSDRPKLQSAQGQDSPLLMLDTGGHMALIKGLTFTPDGKGKDTIAARRQILTKELRTT
jgi:hypothetical protein